MVPKCDSATKDLDLQEAFIDGSFAPAKPGGARVGKKRCKGSKIMTIADRRGSRSPSTYRRIVVGYERFAENFLGMLHLACSLILLRGL